jgi:hypothetical protein
LVFNLYVLDDYSHREIAEMLNITTEPQNPILPETGGFLKEKIQPISRADRIRGCYEVTGCMRRTTERRLKILSRDVSLFRYGGGEV